MYRTKVRENQPGYRTGPLMIELSRFLFNYFYGNGSPEKSFVSVLIPFEKFAGWHCLCAFPLNPGKPFPGGFYGL